MISFTSSGSSRLTWKQYDENDPYDRRKSQFIMKAKLDEIERVPILTCCTYAVVY